MNADNSPVVFGGWGGFVEKAVAVLNGQLITRRANAFATLKSSVHAGIMNTFIEEHLWANGNLQCARGYAWPIIGNSPVISSL